MLKCPTMVLMDISCKRGDLVPTTAVNVLQYRQAEMNRDSPRVLQLHSRADMDRYQINKQHTDRKQNAGTKIPQQDEEAGKH